MARLTRFEARDILQRCGAPIGEDFHKLDSERVECLLSQADALKYRKPKSANGSRARYFHDYLQRCAAREE